MVTVAKTRPPARSAARSRPPKTGRTDRRHQDQAYADPHHDTDQRQHVPERQADAEAERHLPGGDQPAGQRPAGTAPLRPVAVRATTSRVPRASMARASAMPPIESTCRCPAWASFHGRVPERDPGQRGPDPVRAELTDQGVRPDEGERVHQHVQDVVADHRRDRPLADHAERGVAEQGVGVRVRVALGEERVRVPELGRIGEQGVPAPGDLPRLQDRVAGVLRDGLGDVAQRRPGEQYGQQQPTERGEGPLVPQQAYAR